MQGVGKMEGANRQGYEKKPWWPKEDVLEFRKNGDAIIETIEDDDHFVLQVYDPCLGRISGDLGMDGIYFPFSIRSYMETLLLLDE
nr:putative reverse transcriptase domain-containing protein [Tanacetum cinerariifolium]